MKESASKINIMQDIPKLLMFSIFTFALLFLMLISSFPSVQVLRIAYAILLIALLPGYMLGCLLFKGRPFLDRMVLGIASSILLGGIVSYYAGLMGFKAHYFMPVFLIIVSTVFIWTYRQSIRSALSKPDREPEDKK